MILYLLPLVAGHPGVVGLGPLEVPTVPDYKMLIQVVYLLCIIKPAERLEISTW
jgi:hypothetical protein